MKSAYLDHAATTPMLPEAIEAMTAQLGQVGNASSLHAAGPPCPPGRGGVARDHRGRARRPAQRGRLHLRAAPRPTTSPSRASTGRAAPAARPAILISAIEHHAMLDPAHWLGDRQGATVELLDVDEFGRVHPDTLRDAIERDPDTSPWSAYVGQQRGRHRPAGPGARRDRPRPRHPVPHRRGSGGRPAPGVVRRLRRRRADALRPQGRRPDGRRRAAAGPGRDPVPVLHGGGQERDVRSGTLDAPAVAGLAIAVAPPSSAPGDARPADRAARRPDPPGPRGGARRGPQRRPGDRLPGNAHFSFPGCEGDALLMLLDAKGVECSTGSACSAGVAQPSHVLLAMGADAARPAAPSASPSATPPPRPTSTA